jgi:hypothetical protein
MWTTACSHEWQGCNGMPSRQARARGLLAIRRPTRPSLFFLKRMDTGKLRRLRSKLRRAKVVAEEAGPLCFLVLFAFSPWSTTSDFVVAGRTASALCWCQCQNVRPFFCCSFVIMLTSTTPRSQHR